MWTEELRFCPRYCECTCSQRHVHVADTFPDGMSQRFMCLGYYYSSESGPGSFMATRDELRTVSQYKIEAATVSPSTAKRLILVEALSLGLCYDTVLAT